jgi:hypothetical protein
MELEAAGAGRRHDERIAVHGQAPAHSLAGDTAQGNHAAFNSAPHR